MYLQYLQLFASLSNYFQAPRHTLLWFSRSCFLSKSSRRWSAVRQFENAAPSRTIPKYFDLPDSNSLFRRSNDLFVVAKPTPLSNLMSSNFWAATFAFTNFFHKSSLIETWLLFSLFGIWLNSRDGQTCNPSISGRGRWAIWKQLAFISPNNLLSLD